MDAGTITLAIAVLVPAVGAIVQAATLAERVRRHDRSIEEFGKRIGKLEADARVVENELSRPHTLRDAEGVVRR
jgi:uncharacterized protein YoxC